MISFKYLLRENTSYKLIKYFRQDIDLLFKQIPTTDSRESAQENLAQIRRLTHVRRHSRHYKSQRLRLKRIA